MQDAGWLQPGSWRRHLDPMEPAKGHHLVTKPYSRFQKPRTQIGPQFSPTSPQKCENAAECLVLAPDPNKPHKPPASRRRRQKAGKSTNRQPRASNLGNAKARGWWRRTGSNRRPQACKASALPTELRPQSRRSNRKPISRRVTNAPQKARCTRSRLYKPAGPYRSGNWWAREDLNLRPHAYQACALTN